MTDEGAPPPKNKGGRPKGSRSRPKAERMGPWKEDAHSFLVSVYQDSELPLNVRMKAAADARTFEKPTSDTPAIDIEKMTDDELDGTIADLIDARAKELLAEGYRPPRNAAAKKGLRGESD